MTFLLGWNEMKRLLAHKRFFTYIVAAIVFVVVSFGYYVGFYLFDYVVPFGDDPVRHISNAIEFRELGEAVTRSGELDPPFIRILFASLSELMGVEVYQFVTYFMPLVSILIIFSSYFFAKRIFKDDRIAILALVIFAFITPQPGVIFNEGTYMNLLAALLIFPMFVLSIILFQKKKMGWFALMPIVLGVGVMGYHSLTSIYLAIFLLISSIVLFIQSPRYFFKKYIPVFGVTALIGSFVAYDFFVGRSLQFVLSKIGLAPVQEDEVIGGISQDPASVLANFDAFSHHLGFFVFTFGLLGLMWFVYRFHKTQKNSLLFLAWPLALFVGSQIDLLPLSQRFARDTVYAFVLLAAFFLGTYVFSKNFSYKKVSLLLFVGFVLMSSVYFIEGRSRYNGLMRVKPIDLQAYDWVDENIEDFQVVLATSGVVNGGWGSYVSAITKNSFIDGGRCDESQKVAQDKCVGVYAIDSDEGRAFLEKNNVEFVYSNRNIEAEHFLFGRLDYSYRNDFEKAPFLKEKKRFKDVALGEIVIYSVDRELL